MFERFLHWIVKPVSEATDEVAVCEFDCSRTECLQGDWQQCRRRLGADTDRSQETDRTAH